MPRKYLKYKKKNKKKNNMFSRSKSDTATLLTWNPTYKIHRIPQLIVPDGLIVNLPFSYRDVINPAASGVGTITCIANDVYNPVATGEQAHGFDQWMSFYNHFVVLKSSIKFTAVSDSAATSTGAGYVTVALRDDATLITDADDVINAPKSRTKLMTATGAGGTATIKYGYKMNDFFKSDVTQDDSFEGTTAASPSEKAYYHCSLSALGAGADIASTYIKIDCVYTLLLRERKDLSPSVV